MEGVGPEQPRCSVGKERWMQIVGVAQYRPRRAWTCRATMRLWTGGIWDDRLRNVSSRVRISDGSSNGREGVQERRSV